jgi:hypothetical protein
MDEDVWRRFVAFCKIKDVNVNAQLKDVLSDFLNRNLSDLLRTKGGKK